MSYLTVVSAFGRHCGHTTQLTTVSFNQPKIFWMLFLALFGNESRSSPSDHSCKGPALVTITFVKSRLNGDLN